MRHNHREYKHAVVKGRAYTTVPALDAIRGQRSACGDMRFQDNESYNMEWTHAFFCDRASDGRALHLTLGVDDDTSVILFQR